MRGSSQYPQPGEDVHEASTCYGLHNAGVVIHHNLELRVMCLVGGAKHESAHHVGDRPHQHWRWIQRLPCHSQQVRAQVGGLLAHCRTVTQ